MSLTLNMVGGGGGTLKDTDAILTVYVPAGSTVTAAKNGLVLTPIIWNRDSKNTQDCALFSVPSNTFDSSDWTISASLVTESVSDTIVIDSADKYNMKLSYHVPAATYQEVEYIASSGSQWINTNITSKPNLTAHIKFMSLEVTGDVIFGNNNGDDSKDWRFFNYSSKCYLDMGNGRVYGGTCAINNIYEFEIGNHYVKDIPTGTTIISGSARTWSERYNINLNRGQQTSKNRWYYVKMYEDNDVVAELYPCYRISDKVAGMYDRINNAFRTNSGSGTFTLGPEV